MTATNMCSNFIGFRCGPPLLGWDKLQLTVRWEEQNCKRETLYCHYPHADVFFPESVL